MSKTKQNFLVPATLSDAVEVTPTVTIDFSKLHAVTRNRIKRALDRLYINVLLFNSGSLWDFALLIKPHLPIDNHPIPEKFLAQLPKHERDELEAHLALTECTLKYTYGCEGFVADFRGKMPPVPANRKSYWVEGEAIIDRLLGESLKKWRLAGLTVYQREFRDMLLSAAEDQRTATFESVMYVDGEQL